MAEAANRIRIKYGLRNNPTDAQVRLWAQLVRQLVGQGHAQEKAGVLAAQQLFSDYGTMVYASEADTLETLLRLAEGR